MIGSTIGNYVVREKIGEGGMGVVYLAEHPRIGRRVAIKVLLPELSKNPEIVARFFTEARSANEIRNQHIIDILDFGEFAGGGHYFIMEWLEGRSLTGALMEQPQFQLGRALHVARGTGEALAAAHNRGIVHRDLKPDNIYLVLRGEDTNFVKVLDFGIVKLMQNDPSAAFKTQTGVIMGTPAYMSPEQCRGAKELDHRTDIYSLGVILFQMVTGRLPFDAEGLGDLLLAHMTQPPPVPSKLNPHIPPLLEQTILRALEKEPAKRFARMEELLGALATVAHMVPAVSPQGTLIGTGAMPSFPGFGGPSFPGPGQRSTPTPSPVVEAQSAQFGRVRTHEEQPLLLSTTQSRTAKRKTLAMRTGVAGLGLLGLGFAIFFGFYYSGRSTSSADERLRDAGGATPNTGLNTGTVPAALVEPTSGIGTAKDPVPDASRPLPDAARPLDAGVPLGTAAPTRRGAPETSEGSKIRRQQHPPVRTRGIGPSGMTPDTNPDDIFK